LNLVECLLDRPGRLVPAGVADRVKDVSDGGDPGSEYARPMGVLPAPMLARSGPLPADGGYAFELKWDGFRAIARTGGRFQVRSRRGWNMTQLLPELAALPVDAVLDGELVALGDDGWPHFPLVCQRLLNGRAMIRRKHPAAAEVRPPAVPRVLSRELRAVRCASQVVSDRAAAAALRRP